MGVGGNKVRGPPAFPKGKMYSDQICFLIYIVYFKMIYLTLRNWSAVLEISICLISQQGVSANTDTGCELLFNNYLC